MRFKDLPEGTKEDVRVNGVRVYMMCQGFKESAASLITFTKMFLGGLTTHEWIPWFGSHIPRY